jgi:hypothetical protein
MSHTAQAQSSEDDNKLIMPKIGRELPNLTYWSIRETVPDPGCRHYVNKISIVYPTNTGSPIVDNVMVSKAQKKARDFAGTTTDNCIPGETNNYASEILTSFSARSPGRNYLSLMITDFTYLAGNANGGDSSESYLFDLRNGKILELRDIFPNPGQAMPELWQAASKAWCDLSRKVIPREYNDYASQNCGRRSPPMPNGLKGNGARLSALGSVMFGPEGMIIHDDMPFAHAYGPQDVTIPKSLLLRLGARPDLWD